jgi:hypothetical protein
MKYNKGMIKDETIVLNRFKLDRFSPLMDDALLLNIDLNKYKQKPGQLFQATILGLFENKKELIILFYLPQVGQRLTEMVINKNRYSVNAHEEIGYVHKYAIHTEERGDLYDHWCS